jgi:hypothetical protein
VRSKTVLSQAVRSSGYRTFDLDALYSSLPLLTLHDHSAPYRGSWSLEKTGAGKVVAVHAVRGDAKDLSCVIEQHVFQEIGIALDFTQFLLSRGWAVRDVHQGGEALWHELLEGI